MKCQDPAKIVSVNMNYATNRHPTKYNDSATNNGKQRQNTASNDHTTLTQQAATAYVVSICRQQRKVEANQCKPDPELHY